MQENSRTINMLEKNLHLNLVENEIFQEFSLLAKFTKLNDIRVVLYQILHDGLIQDLEMHAFR